MHDDRSVTISEEAMGFLGVGEQALQLTGGAGGERGVGRLGGCRLADDDDEIGGGTLGHRHPQRVPDVTLSPGSRRGWTWRTVCAVSNEPTTPEAAHRLPSLLPRFVGPAFGIPRRLCRNHIPASNGAAYTRTEYFVNGQVRAVRS
jgi:hypothetical protein